MQEVKNLLARVFNFAAFQFEKAKTQVFAEKPARGFKDFAEWQKIYFLDYIQLNRYCQYL